MEIKNHMNDDLWRVSYNVRNDSPKQGESCVFVAGFIYVEANNIHDAIYDAQMKLKLLGYDTIEICGCILENQRLKEKKYL
jgi:hypothetical protein